MRTHSVGYHRRSASPSLKKFLETMRTAQIQGVIFKQGKLPEGLIEFDEPRKIPFSPLMSSENSGQFLVRPLYDKAEVLNILTRKNSKGLGWGTTDKDVYLLNLFLARTVSATAQVDEHYRDFIFRQPSTTVFYLFVDCVFGVLDKCLASAFNNFTRQIDVYMIEGGSRDTRVKNFHGQSPGSQFPELLALMKDFSIETSRFGEKYSRLLTEVVTTYGCSGDADILGIELSPRMTGFLEDTQASTGPTLNDFLTPSEFAGVLNRFLDLFEEYKSKMESLSSQVVRATSGKVSGLNLKPVEQTIQMIKLLSNLVRASSTEESKSFESSEKRISEFFFKVLLQSNTYLSYAWRMRQLFDQDSLDFTSFPEFLNIVLLNINLLYGVRDLFGLVHQNRAKQINILKSCLTRKCDPSSFSKMFDDEMYKQLASSSLSGVSTAMSLYTDSSTINKPAMADIQITLVDVLQEFFTVTLIEMKRTLLSSHFDEDYFLALFCTALNVRAGLFAIFYPRNKENEAVGFDTSINAENGGPSSIDRTLLQTDIIPVIAHYLHCEVLHSEAHRLELADMINHALSYFIRSEFDGMESFLAYLRFRLTHHLISMTDDKIMSDSTNFAHVGFDDTIRILVPDGFSREPDLSSSSVGLVHVLDMIKTRLQKANIQYSIETPLRCALFTLFDWLMAYSATLEVGQGEPVIDETIESNKITGYLNHFLAEFERVVRNPEVLNRDSVMALVNVLQALGVSRLEVLKSLSSVSFNVTTNKHFVTIEVEIMIQTCRVTYAYNFRLPEHGQKAFHDMVVHKTKLAFSHLFLEVLGEGEALLRDVGLNADEVFKVLSITDFNPARMSRAAKIISKIGYHEFINLHNRCKAILEEILQTDFVGDDAEIAKLIVETLRAVIPEEIPCTRYIMPKDRVTQAGIQKQGRSPSESKHTTLVTEYFKHLFSDMTVFQSLAAQETIKHVTEQIEIFRQYNFTGEELLVLLRSSKTLLYWSNLYPNISFKTFWSAEVEEFLLMLDITNRDEVRDLILAFPRVLEPGLLSRTHEVIKLYAEVFGSGEEAQLRAFEGIRRCKELLFHQKRELEVKLVSLSSLIMRSTISVNCDKSHNSVKLDSSNVELVDIQRQILRNAPELLFYSGNLDRFSSILGLCIGALERGYLHNVDTDTLKRLNRFNPIIIRLALDLYESTMTEESFLTFIGRLNNKLREFFGLGRREFIKSELVTLLDQYGYEKLKEWAKILTGIVKTNAGAGLNDSGPNGKGNIH